jgi:hypothetical protein
MTFNVSMGMDSIASLPTILWKEWLWPVALLNQSVVLAVEVGPLK